MTSMIRQHFVSVRYSFRTNRSCLLYQGVRYKLSAINSSYYKDFTVVLHVLAKSVPYTEVPAVKGVHYIEVPLY